MKKIFALCLWSICIILYSQTNNGVWSFQSFDKDILKITWEHPNIKNNEQFSDAVILKSKNSIQKITGVIQNENFVFSTTQSGFSIKHQSFSLNILQGFFTDKYRGIKMQINQNESFFGGGERTLPLKRNGQKIPLENAPAYGYSVNAAKLNYSVPLLLSSKGYGIFFNNPSIGYFDIGSSNSEILEAGFESGKIEFYIIPGENIEKILEGYTTLTGTQPLPPRWVLGNFISRFGYQSQAQAEKTVSDMQVGKFPSDAIILDLFWFGDSIKNTLGNLDWNKPKWPNPKLMISNFKKQDINTVLITEPFFLKGTKNYNKSLPFLAIDSIGNPYTLKDFYFGQGGIIDLFRNDAQKWFWNFYKKQTNMGVAGWWGDLGEPEKHPSDMYHNLKDFGTTRKVSANEIHNLYGHMWSKMLFTHWNKTYPKQRLFFLNRAGFAGTQRFSIFPWTGDVSRSWSGLKSQLPNLQSMSISGIPYIHSDAGGFAGGEDDRELYLRWLQMACFSPVFRPHGTALGDLEPNVKDIPSEPIYKKEPHKTLARKVIQLRYSLLPYNYSLSYEQTSLGHPLIRPMFYENFLDTNLIRASNQYMWGDAFLVAPVLEEKAETRNLYLPEGKWYNFTSLKSQEGPKWINEYSGLHYIPLYIKEGSFIPTWKDENIKSTDDYSMTTPLFIQYFPSHKKSNYIFYDDNGKDVKFKKKNPNYQLIEFQSSYSNNELKIDVISKNWPKKQSRKMTLLIPSSSINKNSKFILNEKNIEQKPIIKEYSKEWIPVEFIFNGTTTTIKISS
jgi:oligosaccharide 4-alpha-D-glucosyltransferase